MKNLFRVVLTTLILLLSTTMMNAQLLPVSLGIKGGANLSNFSADGYKSKSGFNAGLTVDLNLPSNMAIMSGLEVTTKGAKHEEGDFSINAMYLQLPVHLGYKFGIPGVRFHFNFGPYFAQGIGGKTKGINSEGSSIKYDTFGDNPEQMKKFDWGIGMGIGATLLGKIQVRVGYDHGLTKVSQIGKIKNRNAYISAGFIFF